MQRQHMISAPGGDTGNQSTVTGSIDGAAVTNLSRPPTPLANQKSTPLERQTMHPTKTSSDF